MATQDLVTAQFDETIANNDVVFVDFWAGWCRPCTAFASTYAAVAEQHPDAVFAKVDTEAQHALAVQANIRSIPTLMAFKKGHLVFSQSGALSQAALENVVKQIKDFDIDTALADRQEKASA